MTSAKTADRRTDVLLKRESPLFAAQKNFDSMRKKDHCADCGAMLA
jgi:hypothetical protein